MIALKLLAMVVVFTLFIFALMLIRELLKYLLVVFIVLKRLLTGDSADRAGERKAGTEEGLYGGAKAPGVEPLPGGFK